MVLWFLHPRRAFDPTIRREMTLYITHLHRHSLSNQHMINRLALIFPAQQMVLLVYVNPAGEAIL